MRYELLNARIVCAVLASGALLVLTPSAPASPLGGTVADRSGTSRVGAADASDAARKVYFIDTAERLTRTPRWIATGASQVIQRLHGWRGWDGPRAVGRGIFPYNDCKPFCASGTITRIPVTVILSDPRPCGRVLAYRRLEYLLARKPEGAQRRGVLDFGFACD